MIPMKQQQQTTSDPFKQIRLLEPSEIEVRVQQCKETGCGLLLYINARAAMNILDETFGVTGWQRNHVMINNSLYCTISVWDEMHMQWVHKQDIGTESNTEKAKGETSDAFKRACVNIGIARELYSTPFIWVKLENGETKKTGERYNLVYGVNFKVSHISYNDKREIAELQISDQKGNVRYSYGVKNQQSRIVSQTPVIDYSTGEVYDEEESVEPATMPLAIKGLAPKVENAASVPNVPAKLQIKPLQAAASKSLSMGQIDRLFAIGYSAGYKKEVVKAAVLENYGVEPALLTGEQYKEFCDYLLTLKQNKEEE